MMHSLLAVQLSATLRGGGGRGGGGGGERQEGGGGGMGETGGQEMGSCEGCAVVAGDDGVGGKEEVAIDGRGLRVLAAALECAPGAMCVCVCVCVCVCGI